MPDFVKLRGTTVGLTTTANAVANSTCVRIVHTGGGSTARILTQAYANGTTFANTYIAPNDTLYLFKGATDTLKVDTGTDVYATPVAIS
jgi:hypothetical protein